MQKRKRKTCLSLEPCAIRYRDFIMVKWELSHPQTDGNHMICCVCIYIKTSTFWDFEVTDTHTHTTIHHEKTPQLKRETKKWLKPKQKERDRERESVCVEKKKKKEKNEERNKYWPKTTNIFWSVVTIAAFRKDRFTGFHTKKSQATKQKYCTN